MILKELKEQVICRQRSEVIREISRRAETRYPITDVLSASAGTPSENYYNFIIFYSRSFPQPAAAISYISQNAVYNPIQGSLGLHVQRALSIGSKGGTLNDSMSFERKQKEVHLSLRQTAVTLNVLESEIWE